MRQQLRSKPSALRRSGTAARRSSGSRRCRSATAGSARWCSAASSASGCSSTRTRSGPAGRATGTTRTRRRRSPRCGGSIAEGKYVEADRAARGMQGPYTQSYVPLGNLVLTFEHGDAVRAATGGSSICSRRSPTCAIASATTNYVREVFASHPDQVIVVRLSADRPGMITFTATLDSLLRHDVQRDGDVLKLARPRSRARRPELLRQRHDPDRLPTSDGGMSFEAHLSASPTGGRMLDRRRGTARARRRRGGAAPERGHELQRLRQVARARGQGAGPDRRGAASRRDARSRAPRSATRTSPTHRALFDRVSLELVPATPPDEVAAGPADRRAHQRARREGPRSWSTLLFQYGRYLLIASSRPGTQPANLQGIWNDQMRPPWSSNYTININAQMNYWPAESDQSRRAARAVHRLHRARRGERASHRAGELRRARLGGAPQQRHLGAVGAGGRLRQGRSRCGRTGTARRRGCRSTCGSTTPSAATCSSCATRAYPVMKAACEFYLDLLVRRREGASSSRRRPRRPS